VKKFFSRVKSRKNAIFRFNTQAIPSLNHGSVFSLRKCQIQIPHIFLPLEGVISRKNFENFFTWMAPLPPLLCSSSSIFRESNDIFRFSPRHKSFSTSVGMVIIRIVRQEIKMILKLNQGSRTKINKIRMGLNQGKTVPKVLNQMEIVCRNKELEIPHNRVKAKINQVDKMD
jgi:hypothetical protein